MIQDGARPALIVAPGEGKSYKDPDALPPADDIRATVVEAIGNAGFEHNLEPVTDVV